MGQQQLLLIILGVIVVGIAVIVGITMFQDNAISANRDAVVNDLVNLGARAQQYYRRPVSLGGGGNQFTGLTMAKLAGPVGAGATWTNPNGTYSITTVAAQQVILNGKGTEKSGGILVEVNSTVTTDSLTTVVVH
ncbi:MAG: hypothetical protein AABZ61_03070 [Bacteroidota bacterium]